jgi:hypothetical protein
MIAKMPLVALFHLQLLATCPTAETYCLCAEPYCAKPTLWRITHLSSSLLLTRCTSNKLDAKRSFSHQGWGLVLCLGIQPGLTEGEHDLFRASWWRCCWGSLGCCRSFCPGSHIAVLLVRRQSCVRSTRCGQGQKSKSSQYWT